MANASQPSTTDDLLARLRGARTVVAPGQINPPEAASAPPPAPEAPKPQEPTPDAPQANVEAPDPPPLAATKRKYVRKLPALPEPSDRPIGTLYVDSNVIVGGQDVVLFSELLAEATKVICATEFHDQNGKAFHIDDYRFMPYGQGGAVLQAAVLQVLKPCTGLELDSHTPEGSICVQALMARADRVVRGSR